MDFLLIFIILSTRKILLCGATCPTVRLIEEHLIVLYLPGLETRKIRSPVWTGLANDALA